jgi:hypothetical protein
MQWPLLRSQCELHTPTTASNAALAVAASRIHECSSPLTTPVTHGELTTAAAAAASTPPAAACLFLLPQRLLLLPANSNY